MPQSKRDIAIVLAKKRGRDFRFHAGRKGSGSIRVFDTREDAEKEKQFFQKMFAESGMPLSVGKITRGNRRPTAGTGFQKRFQTSTTDTFIDKDGKIIHLSGVQPSHINLEQMPMKMFEVK